MFELDLMALFFDLFALVGQIQFGPILGALDILGAIWGLLVAQYL